MEQVTNLNWWEFRISLESHSKVKGVTLGKLTPNTCSKTKWLWIVFRLIGINTNLSPQMLVKEVYSLLRMLRTRVCQLLWWEDLLLEATSFRMLIVYSLQLVALCQWAKEGSSEPLIKALIMDNSLSFSTLLSSKQTSKCMLKLHKMANRHQNNTNQTQVQTLWDLKGLVGVQQQ